jgi:4-hydroxy-tetrahydrodipicolinate reductase
MIVGLRLTMQIKISGIKNRSVVPLLLLTAALLRSLLVNNGCTSRPHPQIGTGMCFAGDAAFFLYCCKHVRRIVCEPLERLIWQCFNSMKFDRRSVMTRIVRVGIVGYGKAGRAVANVLSRDPRFDLRWIARRSMDGELHPGTDVPVISLHQRSFVELFDSDPVDALVDFSSTESIHAYGEEVRRRGIMLVSAISAYSEADLAYARTLGQHTRVLCSPNITLGINFLIVAAKLLRKIAPFADVEILEQHFRDKPEVSGTARKIAETLDVERENITSLRLGGIVGHHEVIFGFPYQTVRLVHNSIQREAFGTGAAFALEQLAKCDCGFYTFDDLLQRMMHSELLGNSCAE